MTTQKNKKQFFKTLALTCCAFGVFATSPIQVDARPFVPAQHMSLDQQIVNDTIDQLIEDILAEQKDDGSWSLNPSGVADRSSSINGGATGLCLYALISAGVPAQHPSIAKGIQNLIETDINGVYALSMRLHVLAHLNDSYLAQLTQDADLMIASKCSKDGVAGVYFNYLLENHESFDPNQRPYTSSACLYGVLGLWEASKRGAIQSTQAMDFWQDIEDYALAQQQPDGGWNYTRGYKESNISMTALGLAMLYTVQQELYRGEDKPKPELTAAINRGLEYIRENYRHPFTQHWSAQELQVYVYYGFERIALASGLHSFNGEVGWYDDIGQKCIDWKHVGGSSIPHHCQDAFRLLFLSRGSKAMWCQKVEIPGYDWHNRPNDLYFLTRNLSNYRENELNWRIISVEHSIDDWMNVPVAYLSVRESIELQPEYIEKLRTYISRGGLLWINPEGNDGKRQAEALCEQLYPELSLQSVDEYDVLADGFVQPNSTGPARIPLEVVSTGGRHLIVVNSSDFGFDFQRISNFEPNQEHSQAAINVYRLGTNQGEFVSASHNPYRNLTAATSPGIEVTVTAADAGADFVEPEAWTLQSDYMQRTCNRSVEMEIGTLENIATVTSPLVHVIATSEVANPLTNAEIAALTAYIDNGGTVFFESYGGVGSFGGEAALQLAQSYDANLRELQATHSILSGEGLGYQPAAQLESIAFPAAWRSLTIQNVPPGVDTTSPRIQGAEIDGRTAILASNYDLTLAAMHCRQFGIVGYATSTANRLLMNISVYADQ